MARVEWIWVLLILKVNVYKMLNKWLPYLS